jgi:Ca-activated chloride channel family protein
MPGALEDSEHLLSALHASNGGRLVAVSGEVLPLTGITLACEAGGGIARTTLRQHFTNPHAEPLELTYSFPLPADGILGGYQIHAGKRVITGRVERRGEAEAHFDQARLEGRTAGLVEQERPNLFTQRLGNIPGSCDVVVELTIDQTLAWVSGGSWEWRFPTVGAPRYLGPEGVVLDAERVTMDVRAGGAGPTASVTLVIHDGLPVPPTSSTHESR